MQQGKPLNRGIHHIGITVPDAEEATAFMTEALGCEKLFEVENTIFDTPERAAALDVALQTRIDKLVMLKCANGASIELFQYTADKQSQTRPHNSDLAGHHIAFQVRDIEVAAAHVERMGGRLCGGINTAVNSPFGGLKWLYFIAPWGLQMEVVQVPEDGIEFQRTTGRAVYEP